MNDLTASEAAAELGLKHGSVRFLCWKKIIKAEKRGRDWFISRDEVERYKRERRLVGRPKRDEGKSPDLEPNDSRNDSQGAKKNDAETSF